MDANRTRAAERDGQKAVEWLSRLNELRREIAWQEEQVKEMRALFSPGSVMLGERVMSTRGASPTESMLLRIETEEEKLKGMRLELEEAACGILSAAGRVKDTEARSLLFMRYMNGLTFDVIAEKMDCSVSRVYKLHRRAVMELADKAGEELFVPSGGQKAI